MLPKTIKNANVFFEGGSWAGKFDEVTFGKLARKLEAYRGGGMGAEIKLDLGYDMPEPEVTLKEQMPELLKKWGECAADGVLLRILAGANSDGPNCPHDTIEMVMRCRPMEIDFGSWKAGSLTDKKVQLTTTYFKYVLNDETLIELDPVNLIEVVGGVDRTEKLRTAIGR